MTEHTPTAEGKRPNSEILWDLVQTFSEEAQSAAKKKATDQGYSLDRGEVSFEETLINLSLNRDILIKSIESRSIPQLPLKIQGEIVADTRKVSIQLAALIGGTDAIPPFVSAVDDLTASIWYSNLQNMSGEVLNLHEKLNQLKTLEKSLRELNHRADAFKLSEERANSGLEKIDHALVSAQESVASLEKLCNEARVQLASAKDSEQQAGASLASAQQSERNSAESAATTRASSAEVDSLKTRGSTAVVELEETRTAYSNLTGDITKFKVQTESDLRLIQDAQKLSYGELDIGSKAEFGRLAKAAEDRNSASATDISSALKAAVDGFNLQGSTILGELRTAEVVRTQASSTQLAASKGAFESEAAKLLLKNKEALEAAEKRSAGIVAESDTKTKERFEELIKLEDVIREKIRLATNFQLFHAFQTRQLAIAKGKDFWRNALFGFVSLSFVLSVMFISYLFIAHPTYDVAFYLKLSISVPLIYAIHFCSTEYSKERELEEEYAFKGNISISLEPYRELVEKMIDKNSPAEAAKYSDFIIASIDKVFTSPMQQILGTKESKASADQMSDTSKGLSKVLGSISDLVQSLAKLK